MASYFIWHGQAITSDFTVTLKSDRLPSWWVNLQQQINIDLLSYKTDPLISHVKTSARARADLVHGSQRHRQPLPVMPYDDFHIS
jgi:hypothetical protein